MFGQTATPSLFGGAATNTGLGQTSLFGSTATPGQTSTFGAPQSVSFGGAAATGTPGTSLFGNTTATQQSSTLFGNNNRFGMGTTSTFGSAIGQTPSGTPIKFVAPTTTDTMVKSGQTHNTTISIHLQCITCMREYEAKSLEELRFEDYSENRKGPQQQQQQLFGGATSLASTGGGLFSGTSTNTFGSTAPSTGLFSNQNKMGFGSTATTTTTTSLFGQNKTSFFNSNPTGSAFQTQPAQGLFGATPAAAQPLGSSLFNTNPLGATNPTAGGLDPSKSFFGGATATPQQPSLFNTQNTLGQNKPVFGAATATPFGQPQTSTAPAFGGFNTGTSTAGGSLFGAATSQPSAFGLNTGAANTGLGGAKPPMFSFNTGTTGGGTFGSATSTNLFGTGSTNTFSTGTGTGLFNSGANTNTFSFNPTSSFANTGSAFGGSTFGSAFGAGAGTIGGLLGSTTNSLFSNNASNIQQGAQMPSAAPSANTEQILTRLQTLPYGTTLQFNGDNSFATNMIKTKFTTDPKTLNEYKINAKSQAEVKVQRVPTSGKPTTLLFDGLDDEGVDSLKCIQDIFQPKTNIKKLVLNHTPSKNNLLIGNSSTPLQHSLQTSTAAATIATTPKSRLNESLGGGDSGQTESSKHSATKIVDDTISVFNNNNLPSGIGRKNKPQQQNSQSSLLDESTAERSYTFEQSLNRSSNSTLLDFEQPLSNQTMPKCGIILNRTDYFIIPSIEDCDALYDAESDTCIVEGFTVGRLDYGSIFWKGPLNVKGLNLDAIVHIRRKEVIVYPDDEAKPPVGSELNRPAQVTLDQVWPINKATREFIKDPEKLRQMRYAEKVENATIKLDAIFKEYRPDTGSWVFTVKHFSKYGLIDDDDDEENSEPLKPKTAGADRSLSMKNNEGAPATLTTTTRGLFPQDQNVQSGEYRFGSLKGLSDWKGVGQPLKTTYSSLEATAEDDDIDGRTSIDMKNKEELDMMRSALFDDDEDDRDEELGLDDSSEEDKSSIIKRSKIKSNANFAQMMPPLFQKRFKGDVQLPPMPKAAPLFRLPKKRELVFHPIPTTDKADIYSVGYSPAPRVNFITGSNRFGIYLNSKVLIFEMDMLQVAKTNAIEKLEMHLAKNSLIKMVEGEWAQHLPLMIETAKYSLNTKVDTSLNNLVKALYGQLVQSSNYARYQERVRKILRWLFEHNKTLPLPENSSLRIIHFLSTNELEFAITTCLEALQPRLAMQLTRPNRAALLAQLDSWKQSRADAHIDRNLLRLYVLLSGQSWWAPSTGEPITVYEGFEWTQQLALLLLFKNHDDQNVADIIGSNVLKSAMTELIATPNVVEYHLLAQHSPWVAIASCPNSLDSWFILQALLAFNVIVDDAHVNRSDSINLFLASQITELKWALYFLLHIRNDYLRNHSVREMLSRHGNSVADAPGDELADYLLQTFSRQ